MRLLKQIDEDDRLQSTASDPYFSPRPAQIDSEAKATDNSVMQNDDAVTCNTNTDDYSVTQDDDATAHNAKTDLPFHIDRITKALYPPFVSQGDSPASTR